MLDYNIKERKSFLTDLWVTLLKNLVNQGALVIPFSRNAFAYLSFFTFDKRGYFINDYYN